MEGKISLKLEGADVALKKLAELNAHVDAMRKIIWELDRMGFIRVNLSDKKAATEEKE